MIHEAQKRIEKNITKAQLEDQHHRKTLEMLSDFKTLMIERKLTPEQAEAMINEIKARVLYEIL